MISAGLLGSLLLLYALIHFLLIKRRPAPQAEWARTHTEEGVARGGDNQAPQKQQGKQCNQMRIDNERLEPGARLAQADASSELEFGSIQTVVEMPAKSTISEQIHYDEKREAGEMNPGETGGNYVNTEHDKGAAIQITDEANVVNNNNNSASVNVDLDVSDDSLLANEETFTYQEPGKNWTRLVTRLRLVKEAVRIFQISPKDDQLARKLELAHQFEAAGSRQSNPFDGGSRDGGHQTIASEPEFLESTQRRRAQIRM